VKKLLSNSGYGDECLINHQPAFYIHLIGDKIFIFRMDVIISYQHFTVLAFLVLLWPGYPS